MYHARVQDVKVAIRRTIHYNFGMDKRHRYRFLLLLTCMLAILWGYAAAQQVDGPSTSHFPMIQKTEIIEENIEFRGLWVTRFEWTSWTNPGNQGDIDAIVSRAASANFNALLFQVRGTGDAFYTPGLEPWSARLNSNNALGQNPGWDPLAYMVSQAHAAGLQVHAYLNVYPAWYGETAPISTTNPTHPFWTWSWASSGWADWRHWDRDHQPMNLNPSYLFASPGASIVADHIVNVAQDIVSRYDLDGLHLDYIRYAGPQYSCDPFSEQAFEDECFSQPAWDGWQRDQISALIQRIYQSLPSEVMLSAAVWPIYQNHWGWPGAKESYDYYYQDSQGWLQSQIIDAVMPMIYPSSYQCPDNSFWTREVWNTLVDDFQAHSNGRYIVAGIGGGYCTFDEIETRIQAGRARGIIGHAIFSYSGLEQWQYWDDLADGPYAEPAQVPSLPWRP